MSYTGKINVYVCNSGHQTITIDEEKGTTPFMIRCRHISGCKEMAQSQFYRVDQSLRPQYGWFHPVGEDYNKLEESVKHHVDQFGLILRRLDGAMIETLAKRYGLTHLLTRRG